MAAQHGHLEVANTLVTHKAILNTVDSSKMSALGWAVRNGHLSVVQLLLNTQKFANVALESRSLNEWTLLHLGAHFGHPAIVEYLINQGAHPNSKASKGQTPLHEV